MSTKNAYIPGFEYDLFISYAHVDNEAVPGEELGWVSTFYKYLKVELAKKIGREVNIWWDSRSITPNQKFASEIAEGLAGSALFIAVYSNGYKQSDYCLKSELKPFYEKAQSDGYSMVIGDNMNRIFPLFLTEGNHKDHSSWPDEFSGVTGFPFYSDKEEEAEYPSTSGDEDFTAQIRRLVKSLGNTIERFKEKAEEKSGSGNLASPSSSSTGTNQQTVFIANVPDSLKSRARMLASELEEKKIQVVQHIPPPHEAVAHDKKIAEIASECSLSVHLLDGYAGDYMEAASMGYRQRQVEVMMEAGVNQFIWVPKDIELKNLDDKDYEAFLSEIQHREREKTDAYEFVRGQRPSLISDVMGRLEQLKKSREEKQFKRISSGVLIDTHRTDQEDALELLNFLAENNVPTSFNAIEDEPGANLKKLIDRLRKVRTLLVLYGRVHTEWIQARVSGLLRLIYAEELGVEKCCVLNVPPEKEVNLDFGMAPVKLINFVENQESGRKELMDLLGLTSGEG